MLIIKVKLTSTNFKLLKIKPTLKALRLRITSPANWTFADFTMTHGLAFGISTTWISRTTKVCALVHDASLVVKTFRIMVAVTNFGYKKLLVKIFDGTEELLTLPTNLGKLVYHTYI